MMISDDKRRDFEDRKLDNVKRQVAHANFAPDKHKQAQEWIDGKRCCQAAALSAADT